MPKGLVWVDPAKKDLNELVEYIAFHDSADKAMSIFEKVTSQAENIVNFPEKGRIVPELKQIGVLTYFEKIQAPYRIVYRIFESHIFIVAVLDGRRDLGEMLMERARRG